MKLRLLFSIFLLFTATILMAQDSTYAERLGFPKGAKVVVLHIDDVGMSYDQNAGTIEVLEKGAAKSCSIMMTCPWVPGFMHYLEKHPDVDAGLHLTLTSEWKDYRWGPLAGKSQVPGLVDPEGAMWSSVADVVKHATADEVEKEVRAQIERALAFGFRPTHLDSHMGTMFEGPFIERYVKMGIEYKMPIMLPAGHNSLANRQYKLDATRMNMMRGIGKMLWDAGLPVLDDLHNTSYDPHLPAGVPSTSDNLRKYKTAFYINAIKELKPGVTYMIMHCIKPTEVFKYISDSGPVREGDYLAMMNPEFKKALEKEGVIVTTMKELAARRSKR
jgi:predicted glycoside hydrolase/deacetylase ChbG (UPF0249 family)